MLNLELGRALFLLAESAPILLVDSLALDHHDFRLDPLFQRSLELGVSAGGLLVDGHHEFVLVGRAGLRVAELLVLLEEVLHSVQVRVLAVVVDLAFLDRREVVALVFGDRLRPPRRIYLQRLVQLHGVLGPQGFVQVGELVNQVLLVRGLRFLEMDGLFSERSQLLPRDGQTLIFELAVLVLLEAILVSTELFVHDLAVVVDFGHVASQLEVRAPDLFRAGGLDPVQLLLQRLAATEQPQVSVRGLLRRQVGSRSDGRASGSDVLRLPICVHVLRLVLRRLCCLIACNCRTFICKNLVVGTTRRGVLALRPLLSF